MMISPKELLTKAKYRYLVPFLNKFVTVEEGQEIPFTRGEFPTSTENIADEGEHKRIGKGLEKLFAQERTYIKSSYVRVYRKPFNASRWYGGTEPPLLTEGLNVFWGNDTLYSGPIQNALDGDDKERRGNMLYIFTQFVKNNLHGVVPSPEVLALAEEKNITFSIAEEIHKASRPNYKGTDLEKLAKDSVVVRVPYISEGKTAIKTQKQGYGIQIYEAATGKTRTEKPIPVGDLDALVESLKNIDREEKARYKIVLLREHHPEGVHAKKLADALDKEAYQIIDGEVFDSFQASAQRNKYTSVARTVLLRTAAAAAIGFTGFYLGSHRQTAAPVHHEEIPTPEMGKNESEIQMLARYDKDEKRVDLTVNITDNDNVAAILGTYNDGNKDRKFGKVYSYPDTNIKVNYNTALKGKWTHGIHIIKVEVKDEKGNVTSQEYKVTVPR